ncbi:MAG TPA: hypothetical protein VF850_02990 [Gemmatimonadaceae bacterium]
MSRNSPQGRRQASTHYHDAARQHQDAARFAKRLATKEERRVQTTPPGSRNSGRTTKTKR